MSFGEYLIFVGFIQKTIKVDLDARINRAYSQWDGHQKIVEDTRGRRGREEEAARRAGLPHPQAAQPLGSTCQPLLQRQFSTALRIVSTPFIQVSLIRWLRIDALAYIY
jgi:hypothetical protein